MGLELTEIPSTFSSEANCVPFSSLDPIAKDVCFASSSEGPIPSHITGAHKAARERTDVAGLVWRPLKSGEYHPYSAVRKEHMPIALGTRCLLIFSLSKPRVKGFVWELELDLDRARRDTTEFTELGLELEKSNGATDEDEPALAPKVSELTTELTSKLASEVA
ncbi:hypothetical protein GH714_043855 [Hevea brasiliensis]|uniref:Uncharacterized protein n=1 Tax=Hevea brasiliensis TaxID=3981 RepID=A0A6A6K2N9_HEVBR|nr:hypothetical protein GH714_043855 [Hevea brasiliensis]